MRGEARRVWVADSGVGSAFQPTLSRTNLLWTTGQFEVVHMVWSADRRQLVYSSNEDIDRMHVWTVDLNGSDEPGCQGSRVRSLPADQR